MTATASPAPPRPLANDFYAALKARAGEIEARYRALTPASARMHEDAKRVIPGSFTRDAVMREPYAPYVVEGRGAHVHDLDGRRLTDFAFNATALTLGHADPRVVAAVNAQIGRGSAYYAPTGKEVALARLICDRLPSAERVRFTNSGSEAVMMALRLSRGFTGRDLVVKFEGSYHGTYDDVQWSVAPPRDRTGPPDRPVPIPDTAGLPAGGGRVLVLPYNDADAVRRAAGEHGPAIAAVIVEPMANRMGLIMPTLAFLAAAREATESSGALLVFDEVIAFRIGYHGTQGRLGFTPDITTLGKCIGGGFPVGAVAGRANVMALTEPGAAGRVTHAGTFNANPITMAAGQATMEALTPDVFENFDAAGERLRARLRRICDGLPLTVTGVGSLFKVNATAAEITDYRSAATADKVWQQLASLALLNEGYWLSKGLQGCISTATTDEHVDGLLEAFAALVRV